MGTMQRREHYREEIAKEIAVLNLCMKRMHNSIVKIFDELNNHEPEPHMEKATKMLMKDEGFASLPMKCTKDKWTVGFGWNLESTAFPYEPALFLLEYQVEEYNHVLESDLSFYKDLSDLRKCVLINMYHCHGYEGLWCYKKMLKALSAADFKKAANEILDSNFARDEHTHARAKRLAMIMKNDKEDGANAGT